MTRKKLAGWSILGLLFVGVFIGFAYQFGLWDTLLALGRVACGMAFMALFFFAIFLIAE